MKRKPLLFRLLLFFFCLACLLPFAARSQQRSFDYKEAWDKADSLALEGLPRSALEVVEEIYSRARTEKDPAMQIKTVIHRMLFQSYTEEESFAKIISELQADIRAAEFPVKQVLHSLLADTYWNYYQQNRYQLHQRSTVADTAVNDFRNWDYERLLTGVIRHYGLSLENPEKQQETNVSILSGVLEGDTSSRFLRPSLYDFLAQRALDMYIREESSLAPRPSEEYLFEDPKLFSDAEAFARMPLMQADSLSLLAKGLALFQELTQFHLHDQDASALIDLDLKRLEFIHRKSKLPHKDSLYTLALHRIMDNQRDLPVSAEAAYALANFYYNQSQLSVHIIYVNGQRRPVINDGKDHPLARRKAHDICVKAIAQYPGSRGARNCQALLDKIEKQELDIKAEDVNLPGEPFRLLITYRNLPDVYLRVVKLWEDEADSVAMFTRNSYQFQDRAENLLLSKSPLLQYTHALPASGDFNMHSAEVKIDALPAGNYAVLASEHENFETDSAALSFTLVEVSGIGFFSRNRNPDQEQEVFVTDRKTGKPLAGVRAVAYQQNFQDRRPGERVINKQVRSDNEGRMLLDLPRKHQYRVLLTNEKDTLTAMQHLWVRGRLNTSPVSRQQERTVFFTDRSIYRPGQTVHFKGLMLLSGLLSDAKTKIWPHKRTEVWFSDANGEEISAIELMSNEFGTFSGTFLIPENGLPGKMTIGNDYGRVSIEVAEYKRPTFAVEFDAVGEIYRLNDSVRISGKAESFSGFSIDKAEVRYTVTRAGNAALYQGKHWRSYIYPPADPLPITHGIAKTDEEGKFSLSFKAEASDTSQVYSYQVTAHITDMNGETRSRSISVNVGNKNLLVTATIAPNISSEQDARYQVSSKNLNGEAQESDISLKIYALKAPEHPLRERLWDAPDQFIMSREEFKRSFPHDIYKDEGDFHNWERENKCLELDFHTDSVETFDLAGLEEYASGYYLAEIHATAASGETAAQRYFFHFQQEEPGVPQTVSNYINVLKNAGESGESAAFLAGTGNQPSYILYEVISDSRISEQRWISAGKDQREILFPLDSTLTPNLAVQFTMVHQNRIYRTMSPIVIEKNNANLEIEMLSFRDKLRPGEKETWTIKISTPENEQAAAEMAATLYDASLDAILPHSWPPERIISPPGVTYYSFSWETAGFLNESRHIVLRTFKERITEELNLRSYETLQLFGYSYYGGYNRSYRDYLQRIKEQRRFEMELEGWEAAFQRQSKSMAEGIIVSGTLKDESGNPLPGVSIQVGGNPLGLTSNSRGEYKIKVPAKGVLVFTALGFKSKEIKVNGRKRIDVLLESDHTALDEVVVVGYGGQKKSSVSGAVAEAASNVMIRGSAAPPEELQEGAEADGNPEAAASPGAGLQDILPRKNFNETAFFYPQLRTDEEGKISIEFTMPESITRWKMLGFAHTKDLRFAGIEKELITSKEVSVSANAPRFLRAGDRFAFTAKVVNLTGESLQGSARLELLDALTLQPVDSLLLREVSSQQFSMAPFSSETLSWEIDVPEELQAITYRVFASAGNHSDGEENTLPVLPNRVLITETLPMQVEAGETRDFSINAFAGRKLREARPYRLTLEYSANPAWYAVQALPYLMEYPYECAEQLFSRYFANSLATTIMNSSPRIKAIFTQWKNTDSDELLPELEKNQELKSALLQETPWVMQSNKDSERKKRLALLFDLNKMQRQNAAVMQKLSAMQLPDGSFPWFAGMRGNRFITQHILAGIGQLRKLNALPSDPGERGGMVKRALRFADHELAEDYRKLAAREDLLPEHLSAFTIHFLYMRSFFPEIRPDTAAQKAIDFYLGQAEEFWTGRPVYQQGMIALVLERNGRTDAAEKIIRSLNERAQHSEDKGMYWSSNRRGYFWHEAPIETQALLIEAFTEVRGEPGTSPTKEVEEMKKWLLLNKQTNNWESTKATVAACYALLLRGSDWLGSAEQAGISLGGKSLAALKPGLKQEAGTGYLKTSWEASEINGAMESIRISNPGEVVSWGALYWQYFAKPESVPASGEELEIHKTLYKETMTESGPLLVPLNENQVLSRGDLVKVRMELKASRDYEYVHLKDLRAAAFEPVDILARYHYQDGLGYYQATKDASTNFFISHLPKGRYVLEYSLRVTHSGTFSNGFARVQCMYAPEFSARSQGGRVRIE
ncbi:A-macroglobulin complement component [Anseongella ginsenosidimutans]|uniref:A-macroglobulin complement component n=1 Tax=Anseongella ginsenosidimutans TaxID=496056 RepID=A0A4R3KW74_9SPHI|nr:alpha-2-macroglobulin family protein [Anseongella ginsenosidimutans]QEC51308.1 hypothetical protein FRZ59_02375 [Anseongella ginsenosidimutans]TCS89999.1 A-macroglobulin complement component [Anseongella ginsenosidimutans]